MPMIRAKDYPFSKVEIQCDTCGRFGRYPLERFKQIVGPETPLPQALRIIAKDCPHDPPSVANLHGKCRPGYCQEWQEALRQNAKNPATG